jgi:hypothetical protein
MFRAAGAIGDARLRRRVSECCSIGSLTIISVKLL